MLYPFSPALLQAFLDHGIRYFVRNPFSDWPAAPGVQCFLMTHYTDLAKANAHAACYTNAFVYDAHQAQHIARLKKAATHPPGFEILSSTFYPDYQQRISPQLKARVRNWIEKQSNWPVGKKESVNLDFYLQFGALYVHLRFNHEAVKIRLADLLQDL
jgi:hypothetical protein